MWQTAAASRGPHRGEEEERSRRGGGEGEERRGGGGRWRGRMEVEDEVQEWTETPSGPMVNAIFATIWALSKLV